MEQMEVDDSGLEDTSLDEPVFQTIWRDVQKILIKLAYVIVPRPSSKNALRDWDLWGPMIFCFTLALTLSQTAADSQAPLVFSSVFVLVWAGSVVVTLNAMLLGGKISFFQCLCVFGYSIFPLTVASVATLFWGNIIFRLVLALAGTAWATAATFGFLAGLVPARRRPLAMYPVVLFYLILGWMVLMHPPLSFFYNLENPSS